MREFVHSIIGNKLLEFKYKDFDSLFVEKDYHSYYLFFFPQNIEELDSLRRETGNIYSSIKNNEELYQPDMDKNITCIFFLCVGERDYYELDANGKINALNKEICLVEEDLNYFKKNVLVYTEKMEGFAIQNVGKFEALCKDYFNEHHFQSYRNSCKENYQYDFLINLFIKIPFLDFHAYQPKSDKKFRTMEYFIEEKCREKKIDLEYIKGISNRIEGVMEEENKLYGWLDAVVQQEMNEKKR